MYAVIDAILVRALPFEEPNRLIRTVNSYPGAVESLETWNPYNGCTNTTDRKSDAKDMKRRK